MRNILKTVAVVLGLFTADGQTPPAALLDQARADLDAGRYAAALAKASQCVTLFQTSDRKSLGASLRVVGLAQMYSGSYAASIRALQEALAIARQLHDFGSEIARLNDLGTADYLQGRYRQALDYYQQADRRVDEVPNDPWSAWARQVTTANIAILYQALGRYDRALALYAGLLKGRNTALEPLERAQLLTNMGALRRRLGDPSKALETYREAQEVYRHAKHADGEIAVLNNIGIVQSIEFADLSSADATFSAALSMAQGSGNHPLAVQALLNRGETRLRADRAALSRDDFKAASVRAHQLGLQEEEWRALFGLARDREIAPEAAHALLLKAVGIVESLRAGVGSGALRSHFLVDKRALYDRLIAASTTAPEAFRWMEQSRARSLQDGAPPALSLEQFQRTLPPGTGLLEYWVAGEMAAVLWISAKETGIRRWTADLRAISKARQALSDPGDGNWKAALRPLADQLLRDIPILADDSIRTLRIVPDGDLTLLPFEPLPLGLSKMLVEKYALSYAPSALLSQRQRPPPPRWRWPWQRSFAGLSDPQPGADEKDARAWAPLPRARTETAQAARTIGGKTAVRTGAEATRAGIEDGSQYPLLHLATHAQADPSDPERSFILLAPLLPQADRYDFLFAREIRGMSFASTDLVTLSACETNLGEFVPGEGVRGFAEAFLGSGARSVLNSLWSVGDTATEELMTRFYSRLASGETAGDALRLAKLEFISHPQAAHPAHWAAFVLNGDTAWKEPQLISWTLLGGGALLFAVAGALVSKRRQPWL